MEFSKIYTLRLMLAQEKKSCDALNATNVNNSNKEDILKSEAKIKKLQEQLKAVCGEVSVRQIGDLIRRIHRLNRNCILV